ncbi:peptidoglycan-binding protein [Amycolatopsis suaedae]|uniref:peptidoglycan-binding protein n=1 Tax=Amycolatopsis suaedae TaxID=2510978 RepID=UPI0013EF0306|nr:peptidoglycan-binding protein [Amycolatopsis suaedae]
MRAKIVITGLAVTVTAGAVTVVAVRPSDEPPPARPATSTVEIRELTRTEVLSGTLTYRDPRELSSPKGGTLTWLPSVGQDIAPGSVLLSVDTQPVVLLDGTVPAWRDLAPGVSDGPDVAQLESSLAALGYDVGTADARWTSRTTKAVKRFQEETGAAEDGVLALGEVVFTKGSVHIAEVKGHVGGKNTPGVPVLAVQSTDRVVTLELDPAKRDLLGQGAQVGVTLPSGKVVPGRIATVSTALTPNAQGKSVHAVTVTLDDPATVTAPALAPVTVRHTATVAAGVLSVPLSAILGVPGGGYAVDVVAGDGAVTRVPVELGAWGDGHVQVSGAIAAGTRVEVPA